MIRILPYPSEEYNKNKVINLESTKTFKPMKKFLLSFPLVIFINQQRTSYFLWKKSGNQSMPKNTERPVHYAVYLLLLSGLERRYPVVYLLHGYSDKEWAGYIRNTACTTKQLPMASFLNDYCNARWKITGISRLPRKDRYEDMIFTEFIPYIDATSVQGRKGIPGRLLVFPWADTES
jgi:hypothetical protein